MRFLSRFASVILWALAVISLLAGALGIASILGVARLATVSDGSSAPVAFAGSLAVAIQQDSSTVKVGDFLLVGAHTAGGSTLGEVIAVEKTEDGGPSVLLKAPGLTMPDEWSYELGSHTYKQQFAVPLIGYPLSLFEMTGLPVVAVIISGLLIVILLFVFRRFLFKRPPADEEHWFAKLKDESDGLELERFGELFVEAGAPAPEIFIEEDTSWIRRRRA